ncbi:MAG: DnaA N-terminal domain-containing protein [Betaproteobacteria bacterium]
MTANVWERVLAHLRERLNSEDFRRWFGETWYASDSGDQVTVWLPTEAIRRYIETHYERLIDEALVAIDRGDTQVRFVVTGVEEEDRDY